MASRAAFDRSRRQGVRHGTRAGALRFVPIILAAAAAVWVALLVAAPHVLSHSHVDGWLVRAAALVYATGSLVCHQQAERSFHLWGVQLPVCARCTGLYVGAAAGSCLALAFGWRSRSSGVLIASANQRAAIAKWRRRLIAAALPTLFSVGLEWVGVWGQSTGLRATLAVPLGLVCAWFVSDQARATIHGVDEVDCHDASVGI